MKFTFLLILFCALSAGHLCCSVGVTSVKPGDSLVFTYDSEIVTIGVDFEIKAWHQTSDGTRTDVTSKVEWGSSDENIAKTTQNLGHFQVLSEGDVTITARFESLTQQVALFASYTSHKLFFTSTAYRADLIGGLSGADEKCQQHATSAGMSGTYIALMSALGVNAKDRIAIIGSVINTIQKKVASNATELWGSPLSNIIHDENGIPPESDLTRTWTGTIADGTTSNYTCDSWTGNTGNSGTTGHPNRISYWISGGSAPCSSEATKSSLYCIEQKL